MNKAVDATVFAVVCAPAPAADFIGLLQQTGFSAAAYRDAHADLAALNWNQTQALSHYLHHGLAERRVAPITLNRDALVALARLPMLDRDFRARLLTGLGGRLFDHVAHPYGPAIANRWASIQALASAGARPYFVAGDSHSHQYALTGARAGDWLLPIHLLCTGGSAAGLGNAASRSGYGRLLRQAVRTIVSLPGADDVPFLLQFGQVDIEFVYHFRRVRDAAWTLSLDDYRAFCDTTLERYIRFATGLFQIPSRHRVALVSVFPPALSDAAWRQGYVNGDIAQRETTVSVDRLRSGIARLEIANLRQRTDIHAYYNDRLRAESRRHGFGFIDGASPLLGADGLVASRYINPDTGGAEHHLDYRVTPAVVEGLIWTCIDKQNTS